MKIGIADTMFSRIDLTEFALQALKGKFKGRIERYTVPGIKDLPVACKKLFEELSCDIVLALGFVGKASIDKQCAHEATQGVQQLMLQTGKHILEVFIHSNETYTEKKLLKIAENRVKKHALNAVELLKGGKALQKKAGTGERQGFQNEGRISFQNADNRKPRIGIVVSKVYPEITEEMLKISQMRAKERKAEVKFVLRVGGSFDTPLAVKRLIERTDIDGVIVLGAVIKGETSHDEIVAGNAARKIADLSVEYSKPIGLGISGPGMTRKQAIQRIEKFASDSVDAVLNSLEELKKLEAE